MDLVFFPLPPSTFFSVSNGRAKTNAEKRLYRASPSQLSYITSTGPSLGRNTAKAGELHHHGPAKRQHEERGTFAEMPWSLAPWHEPAHSKRLEPYCFAYWYSLNIFWFSPLTPPRSLERYTRARGSVSKNREVSLIAPSSSKTSASLPHHEVHGLGQGPLIRRHKPQPPDHQVREGQPHAVPHHCSQILREQPNEDKKSRGGPVTTQRGPVNTTAGRAGWVGWEGGYRGDDVVGTGVGRTPSPSSRFACLELDLPTSKRARTASTPPQTERDGTGTI